MTDAEMISMDAKPGDTVNISDAESSFRSIRRTAQVLTDGEAREILVKGDYGCLAVEGDNGYPYAVPMTYAYDPVENRIYLHGAVSGARFDAVKRNNKACFTVVGRHQIMPEEYTCRYRSAIAFGRVHEVGDREAKIGALMRLVDKYSPDFIAGGQRYADDAVDHIRVYSIDVEYLSGKRSSKDPSGAGTGR